ncbi:MAG: fibro-slime domain-containing protein [Phycisphaerales bacterium]|nr:fibro-slime domain-containing protein [Phycisphaerales bacterium]
MKRVLSNGLLLSATAIAGAVAVGGFSETAVGQQSSDLYSNLPSTLELSGVVRDFRERSVTGGHPDFERQPAGGFGHYMGNIAPQLDNDRKPVFVGGGRKVSTQWRDASNRQIHPSLFNASAGDRAGAYTGSVDAGGIQSAETFAQWYRDVPSVNMSKPVTITLNRQANSNLYVFDDRTDPLYKTRGGFFPINNELFGNSRNESKNFHFTYELATEFIYKPGTGQVFTFIGDDDVWVFINGRLVIDLGGVHSAINQTVHLDRVPGMKPDEINTLHVFHAERHRTQSNFRIETTINLRSARLPNTTALAD